MGPAQPFFPSLFCRKLSPILSSFYFYIIELILLRHQLDFKIYTLNSTEAPSVIKMSHGTVRIVVIGASGYVGARLSERLMTFSTFNISPQIEASIGELVLFDVKVVF